MTPAVSHDHLSASSRLGGGIKKLVGLKKVDGVTELKSFCWYILEICGSLVVFFCAYVRFISNLSSFFKV